MASFYWLNSHCPVPASLPGGRDKRSNAWILEGIAELERSAREGFGEYGINKWNCGANHCRLGLY